MQFRWSKQLGATFVIENLALPYWHAIREQTDSEFAIQVIDSEGVGCGARIGIGRDLAPGRIEKCV